MGALAAPIIGAVGSLLGGLFNKPKNEYVVPDYAKIRAKAEAAGFNPLFAMANAPGQVVQSGGYMGSAISDAAMIMADAVSKQSDAGKLSQVQAQNRALSKQVQSLTLRPKVGGIYSQRGVTPNLKEALGVGDVSEGSGYADSRGGSVRSARPSVGGDAGLSTRPLADKLDVDPRRGVNNSDISTTSGFMVVDNPNVPFQLYVPSLDGDEALSVGEWPTLAASVIGSGGYAAFKSSKFARDRSGDKPPPSLSASQLEAKYRSNVRRPGIHEIGYGIGREAYQYYTHPQTGFTAKRYKP